MEAHGTSHPRSVAIAIQKGGVGKTSLITNIATLLAERGWRILVVDLDPQSNASRDFGITGTDVDDQGEALLESLMFGRPLKVTKDIRPGLDMLVGGHMIEKLAYLPADDPDQQRSVLRRGLEPLHDDYDLILIDHPPLVRPLREIGLSACRHLVVPTRPDAGSIDGVTGIARDFSAVRAVNPELRLLGVVLFAVGASSKALRKQVRDHVSAGLGEVAPVFDTVIRYAEAPATNSRNSGQAVHEYATALAQSTSFTERKKGVSASKLAGDYAALATEILNLIAEREAKELTSEAARA